VPKHFGSNKRQHEGKILEASDIIVSQKMGTPPPRRNGMAA